MFLRNLQSVFDIPRLGSTPTCLSGVYGAQQAQGHEAIAERSKERQQTDSQSRKQRKHISKQLARDKLVRLRQESMAEFGCLVISKLYFTILIWADNLLSFSCLVRSLNCQGLTCAIPASCSKSCFGDLNHHASLFSGP